MELRVKSGSRTPWVCGDWRPGPARAEERERGERRWGGGWELCQRHPPRTRLGRGRGSRPRDLKLGFRAKQAHVFLWSSHPPAPVFGACFMIQVVFLDFDQMGHRAKQINVGFSSSKN